MLFKFQHEVLNSMKDGLKKAEKYDWVEPDISETPNYVELGKTVGDLVQKKQVAYGDSFGKSSQILEILYPDGIKREQYRDMLTLIRIIDKLFRIATRKDAFGENPYMDIAGYGLLGMGEIK